jgi:Histidine kinase-, DNA gyrase B-, and HSP90-like ATPase
LTRGHREEVIPSARRLLTSLRDLGYDFVHAVADIIDNSIAADSDRVEVTIQFDGNDSWVRIADNGKGMSGAEITEAMRLGSHRDYRDDELGKFGLGLKTASLSQAKLITVASRTGNRAQLECRQLDLAEVEEKDRWVIIHPDDDDLISQVTEPLHSGTGTVVLWQNLDRVLNRKDPFGGWAERYLLNLAERLDLHLGMVFGRFLSGEAEHHPELTITINGTEVELWDPFCLHERTEHLPEKELLVGHGIVLYRPFVLPPQRDFHDDTAWRRASGPLQWNRQQGFYIYRADRMIQSGGWSWMRSPDEHTKLARAALEFWPDLDESFEINISKMRVRLPEELRDQLKPIVSFLTKRAEDRYRLSGRIDRPPRHSGSQASRRGAVPSRVSNPEALPSVDRPSPVPSPTAPTRSGPLAPVPIGTPLGNDNRQPGGTDDPRAHQVVRRADALQRAAQRVGLSDALARIREELKKNDPEVAHELGW